MLRSLFRWLFPARGILLVRQEPPHHPDTCKRCKMRLRIVNPTAIVVRGHERMVSNAPFCEACTQDYQVEFSTTCAECGKPIWVTEPIGEYGDGTGTKFVHLTYECSAPGAFVGHWGEGKPVPYPALEVPHG